MGRAINKTVTIVELIKVSLFSTFHYITYWMYQWFGYAEDMPDVLVIQRRIVGLHQNTSIGSTDITDTWEPLEEGLLP